jgi:predicted transcriptional regulator
VIVLGIQLVCLLVQIVLLAFTELQRRKAKDAAVRAGLAFARCKKAAEDAEAAAGIANWEKWPDAG